MSPPRAEHRRQSKQVERRRSAREARARATQRDQARAAQRQDDPHRQARHRVAYAVWAVAVALAVVDFLVYIGLIRWMAPGTATLVLGGPMVLLALAGAILYGV